MLLEPARADRCPAIVAEPPVEGRAGIAVGRILRIELHFPPGLALLGGDGQPREAEVAAEGHAGPAAGLEPRVAADVARDQEGAGLGFRQLPLDRFGALADAEAG